MLKPQRNKTSFEKLLDFFRQRRRAWLIFAGSVSALFLLWLFCLPRRLFDNVPYSTVVTAAGGELLGARVADDGQWRFPPCDSLPEKFAKALVEYEDRRFYSHPGVSLYGIGRAIGQNLSNGRVVSGGSTITMQVVRLHRRGRRNLWEKLVEMFMATRLEWRYSKDELLKIYASHAPFGGNVVGIGAAVWRYLGNDGSDMSWAEAATLAVLQNAPSAIHLSKNRDKLLDKRNRLLHRLFVKGELTPDEYELAIEEPLIGEPFPMPSLAPHLVEYYNVAAHGQNTRTSIDYALQRRVESVASRWRRDLSEMGANDLAVVVADVKTGDIIAYCGNADMATERPGRWVDIARSPRSSGSILKPLLYCAALQEGLTLPHALLPDYPQDFGGFAPKNFDGSYSGAVDASEALALSLNVPTVWLLKEYGVARFAETLKRCGLSSLKRSADSYGLSLILGGAEVTLLDVVGCYARMARFDSDFPLNDSVAVYSTFEAMRGLGRPDGLDVERTSSVQNVAWKTGTSYGARDAWAVGVTPGYVVGVWVGNASGTRVAELTGARLAGPVMFDVFNLLPSSGWFEKPEGRMMKVCAHSGYAAGRHCVESRYESVPEAGVKSRVCPYCQSLPVSLDGLRRVADASEPFEMRSYFMLPPIEKHFYKLCHVDYVEPPQSEQEVSGRMKFIYPYDGAVVTLAGSGLNGESGIVCKATHSAPGATLFWHLDESYIGATTDLHEISLSPSPGLHRLTIIDGSGASETLSLIIVPRGTK